SWKGARGPGCVRMTKRDLGPAGRSARASFPCSVLPSMFSAAWIGFACAFAPSSTTSQKPSPTMPIYPLEFSKRSEEKWRRRAEERGSTSRTPQTGKDGTVIGSALQHDGAFASRWHWLLAIGQGLQSEYASLKQPVEKRLVALLKKLKR